MPTDYTKKKNAELEDLLKARSLPHTGKKADLVARLQLSDAEQSQPASSRPSATTGAEDEIDWEDDAAAASTETGAAAIAAGGVGEVANPTTVPNQKVDVDPSKTKDLKVDPPAPTADSKIKDATTKATEEPTKPPPDFTSGLEQTTLDHELAKRQKRAARFGIQETDEEALKALERAKKFGTDTQAVKGLDQALPERSRKRGRGGEQVERRDGKRSRVRGGGDGSGGGEKKGDKAPLAARSAEKDRLAAEARKKRFNAA
ncbi:MAG: hypothetical protein Q9164_001932 [Protoblastenia rupestris]